MDVSELLQAEGQYIQLFHDESLGSGAYGKVCKAKLNELPCAAKRLHIILFQNDDPQSPTIQRRFVQECELLQSLKHPNVVQYLSVTHDPQSGLPILLMELLDGNLTDFLEHSDGPIAYHIQVNLWHDIALALTYLHSKHIIHRDLSGNNVLLIGGSRAKVTDFGMSMLTNVDVTKSRLTHCPGNAAYMSPEALIEPPIYSEKLDVFSSGVVAIQIITRKFPNPASNVTRRNGPNTSSHISVALVPEIDRRRDHINSIDPKHPMLPVVLRCLSDDEQDRPSARELCRQLVTLKKAPEYTESMQQKSPQKRVREQEHQIQEQKQQIQEQKQQIQEQKQQIQELQKQIDHERQKNHEQHHAVQRMQIAITVKDRELLEQKQQIQELQKQINNERQQNQKTEVQGLLQRALQGQGLQELQVRITELESKLYQDQGRLIEQLPAAFVTRFTAEELPCSLKKHIEEGFQEWEENLCKFRLFCEHPSNGDLMERKLEVHKSLTLGEVTERAYMVLELEKCAVQLEQCQLVRYNEKSGTMRKLFDEPKEMSLGEVVGEPQSCLLFDLFMEIKTEPATLPRHEQLMRAAGVIRTNYSLLWQHLDASKVLPKLVDKSVISEAKKKEVESYQQGHGQNAVIVNALFTASHSLEGLLTICDMLKLTPGKEHIAQHILQDYKQQSAVTVRPRLGTGNAPLLSEISLQFQNLQHDAVDLLVQCPTALTQLKQCLASLVLPLGDGKVASLVDPGSYEAANTIPEFFRLMAPYWNCLSTRLLSLLLEASGCNFLPPKLAEFEEARASSGPLVLFTPLTSRGGLRSVHSLPLEQLQSPHLAESRAAVHAERNTSRITAEVGKPLLHVSCLEEVTTAVCGFFQLPKAALVYVGCSEKPLVLCWLVSRDLLPYMRSHKGGLSGDHLLCKQQITQIAFGDAEIYRCPNHKEVELLEASYYGLLERIPTLLTSVSVDAANAEGQTALYIASDKGHDQIVELLIRREADVNHQVKDGCTPLWAASFHGYQKVVEFLLGAGANPDIQEKDGWTPFHAACHEGHVQIAELLLQAGASLEMETEDGQTALFAASRKGHDQIVELLLKREADVNHQTNFGTPLRIAKSKGHDHIVQLLREANRQRTATRTPVAPPAKTRIATTPTKPPGSPLFRFKIWKN